MLHANANANAMLNAVNETSTALNLGAAISTSISAARSVNRFSPNGFRSFLYQTPRERHRANLQTARYRRRR